jgi:hypothetical protein
MADTDTGQLSPLATQAKTGFETAIPVSAGGHRFVVQALNSQGRVIGQSKPFQ